MVRRGRDFDEDDIRIRANPRGSRPRSRLRPDHEDAADGMVIAVDRGRYTCLINLDPMQDGEGGAAADPAPRPRSGASRARSKEPRKRGADAGTREVVAMKARELGRKSVVVGDRVLLVGDLRGGPDALARVVRVHPREHVLRRTADDTDPIERVIVANADQLVIVTALADPEPRSRMIDRCLVAAYDAGLSPLLCLTKADLADPAALLAAYEPLGVPAIVTRRGGSLERLREALAGRISVLVGYSGVGKSTLVNALVPDADRAIGRVNDVTGRGRHTSASAVVLRLPEYVPERADERAGLHVSGSKPSRRATQAAANASRSEPWTQPILFDDDDLERLSERGARHGAADDGANVGAAADDEPSVLPSGWVVDTPGVRSFGLAHVSPDRVLAAFPDLAAVIAECPRGCIHTADAPDCALDAWLSELPPGTDGAAVAEARVDSVRRLLIALTERDSTH